MPVREGRVYSFGELDKTTFKGLPGMLADSLPDTYGRALFEKWLALTGRTSGNAIETLCFLGKRCMGALEFEPGHRCRRYGYSDRGRFSGGCSQRSPCRQIEFQHEHRLRQKGGHNGDFAPRTSAGGQRARQSSHTTKPLESSVRDRSRLPMGSTTISSSWTAYPPRPDSGRRRTSGVWNTPSHVL